MGKRGVLAFQESLFGKWTLLETLLRMPTGLGLASHFSGSTPADQEASITRHRALRSHRTPYMQNAEGVSGWFGLCYRTRAFLEVSAVSYSPFFFFLASCFSSLPISLWRLRDTAASCRPPDSSTSFNAASSCKSASVRSDSSLMLSLEILISHSLPFVFDRFTGRPAPWMVGFFSEASGWSF